MTVLKKPAELVQKFHEWLTELGISPKVADPFVLGILGVLVTWILGGGFGADQLKLLAVTFVYGVIGIGVPPAAGLIQANLKRPEKREAHPPPRRTRH